MSNSDVTVLNGYSAHGERYELICMNHPVRVLMQADERAETNRRAVLSGDAETSEVPTIMR